jgi:hypothetical protein
MDVSGTHLTTLDEMIKDYNENMRYYNRNVRDLIEVYRDSLPIPTRTTTPTTIIDNINFVSTILEYLNELNTNTPSIVTTPQVVITPNQASPSVTVPETSSSSRNNRYPFTRNERISNPIIYNPSSTYYRYSINALHNINDLENVVVSPNNEDIRNATEVIEYTSSFTEYRCPISLENFTIGEEIRRIKHCGHIFNNNSLIEWFQRNVRCPVCRHDIREMSLPMADTSSNNPVSDESNQQEEENGEEYEEESDIFNYGNLPNREYIRTDLFGSIANTNRSVQINNSLNSFFASYNIPFTIDISYTNI